MERVRLLVLVLDRTEKLCPDWLVVLRIRSDLDGSSLNHDYWRFWGNEVEESSGLANIGV